MISLEQNSQLFNQFYILSMQYTWALYVVIMSKSSIQSLEDNVYGASDD